MGGGSWEDQGKRRVSRVCRLGRGGSSHEDIVGVVCYGISVDIHVRISEFLGIESSDFCCSFHVIVEPPLGMRTRGRVRIPTGESRLFTSRRESEGDQVLKFWNCSSPHRMSRRLGDENPGFCKLAGAVLRCRRAWNMSVSQPRREALSIRHSMHVHDLTTRTDRAAEAKTIDACVHDLTTRTDRAAEAVRDAVSGVSSCAALKPADLLYLAAYIISEAIRGFLTVSSRPGRSCAPATTTHELRKSVKVRSRVRNHGTPQP